MKKVHFPVRMKKGNKKLLNRYRTIFSEDRTLTVKKGLFQ